ncbi:NAD(P)-dependent oxidoreductase [Allocoprobacillus halotolerans]|uniref:NAD(P)-dependent oxidoreductase n=1 Tax=Allocoprobacillus halotolerans TaxID=2944914 RepID=UPI0025B3BFF2|nr:NAD(P)-dependent oxidoreductase [Allocoprobacillus halotolerans]
MNKISAEKTLLQYVPNAYIIRPSYLYGPMNNVYREAFVFECANLNRPFYIPKDGSMKLQFFYIEDLSHFLYHLMIDSSFEHIFNVGNPQSVTIKDWVELCYETCHQKPNFIHVDSTIEQRQYFPFYNYEYALDVQKQKLILTTTKSLDKGLQESYDWYQNHSQLVMRKPLIEFIDKH